MLPPRLEWRKGVMLQRPVSNAALWLALATLVSAPAALFSCGSSALDERPASEDPLAPRPIDRASSPKPVPLGEFAERLAAALCQALDSCCQAAALGSSGVDCEERTRSDYEAQIAATSAPTVRYDPMAGARCVAAFTHFVQGCSYEGKPESDAACQRVFRGTLALDENCQSDAECAKVVGSDVYCAGDLGSRPHSCQRALLTDEPCLLEGCAQGLFCDLGTLSCQPQRSSGECLQFETCSEESACSPSGLCEPKLASGGACQLDLQCRNGVCGADGRCAGSLANSGTCVPP